MHRTLKGALTTVLMATGAFALVSVSAPQTAEACGGFFCDNNQPVNQTAERIIFAQNDDDTVSAAVQIMYQGPSSEFAWLLPVSGSPEVGVSSDAAFQRLQRATDPSYRMNTTVEGTCKQPEWDSATNNGGTWDAGSTGGQDASPDPEVVVVNQGSVGPYDYTTISVNAGDSDPAQAAIDWLTDGGYDVSGFGADLIRPYLEDGMNLIAFKLTKSAETGDIRPVLLNYPAELPMIPIKLTAVAANDDMGVMVWVLGGARALPSNYRSLVLNDAAINWFNPMSNYNDVIIQAAQEAGGQGFVTEYADDSSTVREVIFTAIDQQNWDDINDASQWEGAHGELVIRALSAFGTFDGINLVVETTLPLPNDVVIEEFMDCPRCIYDESDATIAGFSPSAFLNSLDEHVISPMQETEALVDSLPYVTRLYTTMSPADMTLDPIFDFNADLADVSNQHVAERTIYCSEDVFRNEAPWKAELPSGQEVHGVGNSWPLDASDSFPATREVRQEHNSGDGDTIDDNSQTIDSVIAEHNQTISLDPSDPDYANNDPNNANNDPGGTNNANNPPGGDSSGGGSSGGGGGCHTTGTGAPIGGGLALLVLIGCGLAKRRRA